MPLFGPISGVRKFGRTGIGVCPDNTGQALRHENQLAGLRPSGAERWLGQRRLRDPAEAILPKPRDHLAAADFAPDDPVPLSGIGPAGDVPVARRRVVGCEAEEPLERNVSVEPPVVTEDELIEVGVDTQRIQEIVAGKRAITPETALRIGTALGTGARLWLAMQQGHDLPEVEIKIGAKVRSEVQTAA